MAGHARYTVLFDACALVPLAFADSLMSLATTGLFAAKWSTAIENEWITALERIDPRLQGKLTARRDCMRASVLDWEVLPKAWQPLESNLSLPDSNDRHVLAAAIAGHADCIVTMNLKDFPSETLQAYGLEAVHPDDFIVNQIDLDPFTALSAFREMRARRKKPVESAIEFVDTLERHGLVATARRLRDASAIL